MGVMTWRVLVVDDEQSLAKVVASYLERDGHRVNCVFDGPSAVAAGATFTVTLHSAAIGPASLGDRTPEA
jgi:DNA-binding response OmpR family regulator